MTREPEPVPPVPPIAPRVRAEPPQPGEQPSLFEQIGGRPAVERIVEEFYARVERDPLLRPLFPDTADEWERGREKQRLFLEQWLGGEPRYSQRFGHPRLRRRHFPFVIAERHAGRWLRLMAEALVAAGVSEEHRARILAGLGPLAHHMVNAGQPVPREPLGDVWLE